jgi:hypothetical protein
MKALTSSVQKIGIKTGVITSLALIAYFLIMKFLGLERVLEFRYFNFFILLAAISYAINKLKHENEEEDFYLKGMAIGFYTSVVAIFIFSFFISFYLAFIDPSFMKYIQTTVSHGQLFNTPVVFLILFMEGLASGVIITFTMMQFFKSPARAHQPE